MNNGFVEQKSIVERKENTNSRSIMYQERKLLRKDLQESHSTLKELCHKESFWLKSWIRKAWMIKTDKSRYMNADQKVLQEHETGLNPTKKNAYEWPFNTY